MLVMIILESWIDDEQVNLLGVRLNQIREENGHAVFALELE